MRAAVLFRRPKLSCVCFDFHRAPSAALCLRFVGTRHISPASERTKTTQKLNQRFLSHTRVGIFRSSVAHRGRVGGGEKRCWSLFLGRTGVGVWGASWKRRKKKASGVGVSTRSDVNSQRLNFRVEEGHAGLITLLMKGSHATLSPLSPQRSNPHQRAFYVKAANASMAMSRSKKKTRLSVGFLLSAALPWEPRQPAGCIYSKLRRTSVCQALEKKTQTISDPRVFKCSGDKAEFHENDNLGCV